MSSAHDGEVGARGRLVQHRDAAAGQPDGLRGRGDRGRLAGQHADRRPVPARRPRHRRAGPRPSGGRSACTSGHGRRTGVLRLAGGHAVRSDRAAESSSIARNRDMVSEPTVRPARRPDAVLPTGRVRAAGVGIARCGAAERTDLPPNSSTAASRRAARRARRPRTAGAHPQHLGRSGARRRHPAQRRGRRRAGPGRRRGRRRRSSRPTAARPPSRALARPGRRPDGAALRPPRRPAHRRRRALDQPAVRADRARRPALRPRRRRRQGRA